MSGPLFDDDMIAALRPWDGKTWFVERPDESTHDIRTVSQSQGRNILANGKDLTNWEAEICQNAWCSPNPASPGLLHWLNKIERDKCGQVPT